MEENKKMSMKGIVLFIVGIAVGAGVFFAWNVYTTKNPNQVANQVQQAQVKDLVDKVAKLIILPTNEEPVVATINDASALIKDQVFYKGAKDGDVVLVYQKASKAIIYSPSRNVIVNVGPIFLQDQQAQTSATVSAPVDTSASTPTTTTKTTTSKK